LYFLCNKFKDEFKNMPCVKQGIENQKGFEPLTIGIFEFLDALTIEPL